MQIIALDTTTPQLRAPPSGSTYSAPRAIVMTPETLTGSSATSSLSIAQTWNTTGTPTAIDLNVTDTASNVSSLLMNLRVGGVSMFSVTKAGMASVRQGSYNNVGLRFGNTGTSGFYFDGSAILAQVGGSVPATFDNTNGVGSEVGFGIRPGGGSVDVALRRDAANTLAQRNGVNAQAFNVYNTFTDASNYERGFVRWAANTLEIGTERAGTGSNRDVWLYAGGGVGLIMSSAANLFYRAPLPLADNGMSIGTTSQAWSNIFSAGYSEMREMTAPAAPATNRVRIYAEDNGSGKTRLMALFATGAAQQIAIEP